MSADGDRFDLAIVGGGPGGYVAAIRAAQLGLKTVVIEREHLGGICLNWGCIPTKALLRSAEVFETVKHAGNYGVIAAEPTFDLAKLVARSRKIAGRLGRGVGSLLKKHKVAIVDGNARLDGAGRLAVETSGGARVIEATNIILATGARPREIPGLEPDGKLVWTYKDAMVPEDLPASLLVVGAGAIGIEFASFFATFGTEVTVVEMVDRILSAEDEEISALAKKAFVKRGIKIITGAKVGSLKRGDNEATAVIETADGSKEITVARVLIAGGIQGNVEELGLDGTGVVVEKGHIVTDALGATGEASVYAIGDVTGPPWLAHKAMHEGVACVEAIAGDAGAHGTGSHGTDRTLIPGCTYSLPQVASIGLSEAAAKAAGKKVKVGRYPFAANGKALAIGEDEGLVKTVFDAETGELLGAHMIGAEVTELIQGFAIARTLEATEAELIRTVFPHPTLSEMMHESVLDAFDRALHI